MATVWSISYLLPSGAWSGAVAFADAQIKDATRKLVNQGQDQCQISFAGIRPPNVGPLTPGTVVRVLRDDFDGPQGASNPVGWFTGTVVAPKRTLAGNSESASLTLNGPWWYLANVVYRQLGLFYLPAGPGAGNGATIPTGEADPYQLASNPSAVLTSVVMLNQYEQNGAPVDAGTSIADALAYALSVGARFTAAPADVAIAQVVPAEAIRDATCASAIQRVLRWLPDHTFWWDYSVDPPAAHCAPRAARPALTLQVGGDAPQIESCSLQARPDLVLPGVALQYLRRVTLVTRTTVPTTTTTTGTLAGTTNAGTGTTTTTTDTITTTSTELNSLEFDRAGPNPYGIGALVATVELTGGTVGTDGSQGSTFEPTPVGLAQFLYDQRKTLQHSGSVGLHGQDVIDAGNWVGKTVNIAGGDADWTTMAAQVQTATESVAKGVTSLTLGPPDHLGPSDLAALLNANRLRQYVNAVDGALRTGGGSLMPPSNPPATPAPSGGGGHVGDPDADPDEQQGQVPFAGVMELFSGQAAQHFADLGAAYYRNPDPNSGQALLDNAIPMQAPPAPPAAVDAGPGAGGFFHSTSASFSVQAGGADPAKGYPGNVGFSGNSVAAQSYNVGTLDLTGYSALQYTYAELRGSYSHSTADGTTVTDDYQIPVSQYLGLRQTGFRVYVPSNGAVYTYTTNNPPGGGESQSASVTVDSLWVIPRTN